MASIKRLKNLKNQNQMIRENQLCVAVVRICQIRTYWTKQPTEQRNVSFIHNNSSSRYHKPLMWSCSTRVCCMERNWVKKYRRAGGWGNVCRMVGMGRSVILDRYERITDRRQESLCPDETTVLKIISVFLFFSAAVLGKSFLANNRFQW